MRVVVMKPNEEPEVRYLEGMPRMDAVCGGCHHSWGAHSSTDCPDGTAEAEDTSSVPSSVPSVGPVLS